MNINRSRLVPLVISGPSAVGKGKLIKALLKEQSHRFEPCLSYTTRSIRKGQKDGVDYYFISQSDFEKKINNNQMIEHQNVHGNYYGKSMKLFQQIQNRNKIPILDIDINGAKTVSKLIPANCLFLLPPSIKILQQRMKGRGSQTQESTKIRIQRGKKQIKQAFESNIFTYMVCYEFGLSQLMLKYYIQSKYDIKYPWLL